MVAQKKKIGLCGMAYPYLKQCKGRVETITVEHWKRWY